MPLSGYHNQLTSDTAGGAAEFRNWVRKNLKSKNPVDFFEHQRGVGCALESTASLRGYSFQGPITFLFSFLFLFFVGDVRRADATDRGESQIIF